MKQTVLRIDASARRTGSITRTLADKITLRLEPANVIVRDLSADPLPQIDEAWIAANFTPEADRTAEQCERLSQSDKLIAELASADTVLIGLPVYNFGVPTALKAWIDLITRAGVTFRYSETGPVGLMTGKRAIIAMASGGTAPGSEIDYASRYLLHILGFIGITDVSIVSADRMAIDPEAALKSAEDQLEALAA